MSIQYQAAVVQGQEIRKSQFNLLLWAMLAVTAIGISAGLYALYVGHHQAFSRFVKCNGAGKPADGNQAEQSRLAPVGKV